MLPQYIVRFICLFFLNIKKFYPKNFSSFLDNDFWTPHQKWTYLIRAKMLSGLWWKTTFGRRQPSVEDDLQWKMTFSGRWPSVEDNLRWKTTLVGRLPSVEDDLGWKTLLGGRWPWVEDNFGWKTSLGLGVRGPLVEDDLWWHYDVGVGGRIRIKDKDKPSACTPSGQPSTVRHFFFIH